MNKTYVVVGGVAVASLVAGATGGYFFAKKKFETTLDELIAAEVDKTKKYFSIQLMEARQKPATPQEVLEAREAEEEAPEPTPEEVEQEDAAKVAMTNYAAFSSDKKQIPDGDKPPLEIVQRNIFENNSKHVRPARGPDGKFLPRQTTQEPETPKVEDVPIPITHEDFLVGELDYEQENLVWFVKDRTLLDYSNEVVDVERVGESNLELFPTDIAEDDENIICVRNHGLQIDYEIRLTHESLTEYMGLGEDDDPDGYEEEHGDSMRVSANNE